MIDCDGGDFDQVRVVGNDPVSALLERREVLFPVDDVLLESLRLEFFHVFEGAGLLVICISLSDMAPAKDGESGMDCTGRR